MIVLLGSAQSEGKTAGIVRSLLQGRDYEFVDLKRERIAPYNYEGLYPSDDTFLALAERMIRHERVLFATPVYWYAMSGIMKTFFDRLSDLITFHKKLGRALAGRTGCLLATGTAEAAPEGFVVPFQRTCDYFDMMFNGFSYVYTGEDDGLQRQSLLKARKEMHDLS